jgi:hypothetical protein
MVSLSMVLEKIVDGNTNCLLARSLIVPELVLQINTSLVLPKKKTYNTGCGGKMIAKYHASLPNKTQWKMNISVRINDTSRLSTIVLSPSVIDRIGNDSIT